MENYNNLPLPANWRTVKLGEVVLKKTKKVTPIEYPDAKFIGMDCITPHTTKPSFYYDFKEFKSSGNYFEKGNVLYGRMRPYLNKVYKAEFNGACSGEFIVLQCKREIIPGFLTYILHSRDFVKYATHKTSGDRPRISFEEIADYQITIGPPKEQEKSLAKLEELLSELEKGKEQLETAQQQLKVYRQAVLKWAFEGKLTSKDVKEGELPEGWKWVKVKEVASSIGGYAFKSSDFKSSGRFQVLRMGNVRPGKLRFDEAPVFLDEVQESVLKKALLRSSDIIITLTGTRKKRDYGFTAKITKENLLLNQRIAAVRFEKMYNPDFFLYYTWTDSFKDQFFANETGNVGQGNVGMKAITETLIPSCSDREQQEVVSEIESRLSVCDKIEETINQGLQQLETLRQSILKRAFEGRLIQATALEAVSLS